MRKGAARPLERPRILTRFGSSGENHPLGAQEEFAHTLFADPCVAAAEERVLFLSGAQQHEKEMYSSHRVIK